MVDGALAHARRPRADDGRAAIVAEADRVARARLGRLFAERPDLPVPPGFAPGP